jgi:hypothetical protein
MLAMIENATVRSASPHLDVDRRLALLGGSAATVLALFGVQSVMALVSQDREMRRLGRRLQAMYPAETVLPSTISAETSQAVTSVANVLRRRIGPKPVVVEGWHLAPEAAARCLISTAASKA